MNITKLKPELKFSNWYKWEDRNSFPDKTCPGVYMISITDKNLEGKEPAFEDVVYVGMTNSQGGLQSRWNQFNNSINGKSGHSGGNTINTSLGNYSLWTKKLFVCAMSVECTTLKNNRTCEDLIKMGWVAFLEYEALSKFKEHEGKEPVYNTK